MVYYLNSSFILTAPSIPNEIYEVNEISTNKNDTTIIDKIDAFCCKLRNARVNT